MKLWYKSGGYHFQFTYLFICKTFNNIDFSAKKEKFEIRTPQNISKIYYFSSDLPESDSIY